VSHRIFPLSRQSSDLQYLSARYLLGRTRGCGVQIVPGGVLHNRGSGHGASHNSRVRDVVLPTMQQNIQHGLLRCRKQILRLGCFDVSDRNLAGEPFASLRIMSVRSHDYENWPTGMRRMLSWNVQRQGRVLHLLLQRKREAAKAALRRRIVRAALACCNPRRQSIFAPLQQRQRVRSLIPVHGLQAVL
jgi:hypothetical protein